MNLQGILCDACHASWAWAEVLLPSGRPLYLCRHHANHHFGEGKDPGIEFVITYPSETVGESDAKSKANLP